MEKIDQCFAETVFVPAYNISTISLVNSFQSDMEFKFKVIFHI